MSSSPINSASFSLTPLSEADYSLTIEFSNREHHEPISKEVVTFHQQSSVKKEAIMDVFTKNGTCQTPLLKKIFTAKDLKQADGIQQLLPARHLSNSLVAVLDLKNPKAGYLKTTGTMTIAQSEAEICQFFKNPAPSKFPHASNLHSIFTKTVPLDFIICEGSLKQTLLEQAFTDKEIEYLNSKSGSMDFCQTAEFFMNAFKLGQTARVNSTTELSPNMFIKPVSARFSSFEPYSQSTTLYPPEYKEMYSINGPYAKTLSSIFSVTGGLDKATQITTLNVEKKI